MATLNDVARRAGVTAATVSNVIRRKGPVAEETRRRVEAAIAELNYRPNLMARSLAQGRSHTLAFLLPDIANPYYPEIALEIEKAAREGGYQVLLCNTQDDEQVGHHYLERFQGGFVDGVLVMAGGVRLDEVHLLSAAGIPVVLCQWAEAFEHGGWHSPLPQVDSDFEGAAALAAEHLLTLGHRHVAAIVKVQVGGRSEHAGRLRGFKKVLAQAGVALPDERVVYGDLSIEGGRRAAHRFLIQAERPTAIFASNDLMALGAIEAVLDLGLRVPQDVSVIGIDDLAIGAQFRPTLSTVSLSRATFARTAAKLLLSSIEGQCPAIQTVLIQPQLVARQSTAPPGSGKRSAQPDASGATPIH